MVTNIFVLADLLNGSIVEGACIGGKLVDLIVTLNTDRKITAGGVTTLQTTLVNVGSPGGMLLNLCLVDAGLERDNVLSRKLLGSPAGLLHRGTEDRGKDSSEEEQGTLDGLHDEKLAKVRENKSSRRIETAGLMMGGKMYEGYMWYL